MTLSFWSVILPVDAINLVTNPSVETNLTGYVGVSASLARVTTAQRRGQYSVQCTPGTGTTAGLYFSGVPLEVGLEYTFSFDFWGSDGVPYTAHFATSGGVTKGTPITFVGAGAWRRYSVTWQADATATHRLYVRKDGSASTEVFYVDGIQCVAHGFDVTYIDGDQRDCQWIGLPHGSTSRRSRLVRHGGRAVNFDEFGIHVTRAAGIGMPPKRHVIQEQALLAGAMYHGQKCLPRTLDLTSDIIGASRTEWHKLRQEFIAAIGEEYVPDGQPVTLRYDGANPNRPLYIDAVYDSGLEVHDLQGLTEVDVPLRFIAYKPHWYEDGRRSVVLGASQSVPNANYIIARIDGLWQALGTGTNGVVRAILVAPEGIYVGGEFTSAGGVANTTYIARWDGSSWNRVGNGLNGVVVSLALDADGSIYAGGTFTQEVGGAPNSLMYIARWNGTSWSALGTGMNDLVNALAIGSDGSLYAGGRFTSAGGVANTTHVARWDGSSWHALASGIDVGVSVQVNGVAAGVDRNVYIVGTFSSASGVTAKGIVRWDPGPASFHSMDSNLNTPTQYVDCVVVAPNGIVYVGGEFTGLGEVDPADYVAQWTGSVWLPVGNELEGRVHTLAHRGGLLYAGGGIGGLIDVGVHIWNGSTWQRPDVKLPGANPIAYTFSLPGDDVYIGFNTSGTAGANNLQVITNPCSARSYPKLVVSRTGGTNAFFGQIDNLDTGGSLRLFYWLADGEVLTIDLDPEQRRAVSSVHGNVWHAIRRDTAIGKFYLLPGQNRISAYGTVDGGATMVARLEWPLTHLSADGVAE